MIPVLTNCFTIFPAPTQKRKEKRKKIRENQISTIKQKEIFELNWKWKFENILKFSDCAYCEPIFTSCVKRTPQINFENEKKTILANFRVKKQEKKINVGEIEYNQQLNEQKEL